MSANTTALVIFGVLMVLIGIGILLLSVQDRCWYHDDEPGDGYWD